jgi:hypothetical protein
MGRGSSVLKVVAVHGLLRPRIDTTLLPARTQTSSFTIELSGAEVTARPLSYIELDPDTAVERLQDEVRPLLAAAGHLKQTPIALVDVNPHWVETGDPAQRLHRRPVGVASVSAFIIAGPTTTADVEQRVSWATQDALYAELLELLAVAQITSNPRGVAYVMVERIETALGAQKLRRETALAALGLREADVREIVADQSRFDEDRHGEHARGQRRPPIDSATRQRVRDEAARLVRAYEEHVFKANLAT